MVSYAAAEDAFSFLNRSQRDAIRASRLGVA